MPFNLAIFKTRALSAVVFAAVMVGGMLWNGWSFLILFTIIHFGCWYEYIRLLKKASPEAFRRYGILGVFYITVPVLLMLYISIVHPDSKPGNDLLFFHYSPILPCGIIFSIWINDTMAYLVGSFIGRTPFSNISPKKTWEGTAGGAILCVIVISWLGWFLQYYTVIDWVCISAICAVFGTLGDLFESKLKRLAHIKDSGSIMPGHGGFLDRFDSFLVATPFVWLYIKFFIHG